MSLRVRHQTSAPPAAEVEDTTPSDKELADPHASQPPRGSQTSLPSHQDDDKAGPSGNTPTSTRSSLSKMSNKSLNPVDEAIMTMVHTLTENQDLKKSISNVLYVEKNPKKAFMLWFSSECWPFLIQGGRTSNTSPSIYFSNTSSTCLTLGCFRMPPPAMVPAKQLGGP